MSKGTRKLFVYGLIGVGLLATAICFVSVLHEPLPAYPRLSFTGREAGPTYRAAGFYITNCGPHAMLLQQVRVEAVVGGSWKTMSVAQPEFSCCLEPGQSKLNLSPVVEPSERRKIIVHWPDDLPWRVAVQYSQERHGLNAVTAKCRVAWRAHTMKYWRARVWSGFYWMTSGEVRR